MKSKIQALNLSSENRAKSPSRAAESASRVAPAPRVAPHDKPRHSERRKTRDFGCEPRRTS